MTTYGPYWTLTEADGSLVRCQDGTPLLLTTQPGPHFEANAAACNRRTAQAVVTVKSETVKFRD